MPKNPAKSADDIESLKTTIHEFVYGPRSRPYEESLERAEELSSYVDGLVDGLREDIANRDKR